jgi:hypothetical protein
MRVESGTPALFGDGAAGPVILGRVTTTDPSVHEALIRDLVFEHPSVLPVAEIDPARSPLIPIGREIPTAAGPVDALFVSPDGDLTIVEAKLWRNPEARREVVGQIIDYATAISQWSYDDLDTVCRKAAGSGVWPLVVAHADDHDSAPALPESDWVDRVSKGLRSGRFLLLVVGDGIREEVERMMRYVQTAPQLQFTLALVELRIYDTPDERMRLVVPSIVTRTAEITRAVVEVTVAEEAHVNVEVSVPADDSVASRRRLTLDQFFKELEQGEGSAQAGFLRSVFATYEADARLALVPQAASVSLRLNNPSASGQFTVLVFTTAGFAYPGWLESQCERFGVPFDIAHRFAANLSAIGDVPVHHRYPDSLARPLPLELVAEQWEAISSRIEQLMDEVYAVLAPGEATRER